MLVRKKFALLNCLALLAGFSFAATAEEHHQHLNGAWKLVAERCQFGDAPHLSAGTVTIFDRQHNIYVSDDFTYDVAGKTVSYSFRADGPHNASIHVTPDTKSKAKWDGDSLIVTSVKDNSKTVERYSLAADGSLQLTVEAPGHATETLIFEKQ